MTIYAHDRRRSLIDRSCGAFLLEMINVSRMMVRFGRGILWPLFCANNTNLYYCIYRYAVMYGVANLARKAHRLCVEEGMG